MVLPGQERREADARGAARQEERDRRAERSSVGRRGAGARSAAWQGGSVENRGQARSRDTMREYERERSIAAQWDDLYCIWRGVFIGGEDPPRGRRHLGAAAEGGSS
jgi:hypothetical protein